MPQISKIPILQSVIGATNLMGNVPTSFKLITTAGLIFLISVPKVGFSLQRGYANEIYEPNFSSLWWI
jgi:hypothetical protein